jgi:DNA-binding MurR/RpiR family transcriptional regulator
MGEIEQRITDVKGTLTPAERRVADAVLQRPERVAFGTVAELAREARAGGATVLRLAAKLGFEGFSELQDAVQDELSQRLRPAVERIRSPQRGDVVGRVLERELDNVQRTLDGTERGAYGRAVTALSARSRRVFVLSGDASGGIARHVALELAMLREGVCLLEGNEVAVLRHIATAARGDACLAIDLRRYDRWVVATAVELQSRGVRLVVLTDSALSPLADVAEATFSISAESEGPFDSHVGTLALLNALIAGVADRLRRTATERLDRVEDEWRRAGALVGPSGR